MFPFYIILYFLALVVSLLTTKKYYDTPLRYFPLLIAYTFFNELLGYLIANNEEFSLFEDPAYDWHNVIIYNIYDIFFFGYIFWLYHKLLKQRTPIKGFAISLLLAYIVSLFFQDPFHSDLYYASCLGCVFVVCTIVLHFKQFRKVNNTQPNKHNHMVWFGAGMLIFHLFYPYYILNGYLNVEFFLEYKLRQILWVVISVMYSLFTIGFMLGRRSKFC